MPLPEPAAGEVRVRLTMSGVNPGDLKKRQGWLGSAMPYRRVVPYSDGAGVVDVVGLVMTLASTHDRIGATDV